MSCLNSWRPKLEADFPNKKYEINIKSPIFNYRVTHKDKTVKTTQNYINMTIKSWSFGFFIQLSIRLNVLTQKLANFGLQETMTARKQTKHIPYNRLWSLILCEEPCILIFIHIWINDPYVHISSIYATSTNLLFVWVLKNAEI